MAIGTKGPIRNVHVPDEPEPIFPKYLAESLSELRDSIRALARHTQSETRHIDEYRSDTTSGGDSETVCSLFPQLERIPERIKRVLIAGPPTSQSSFQVGNTSTNPGVSATIATLGIIPAGLYSITTTVGLQGTVTAADANNMRLRSKAQSVQAEFVYPGVAGNYPQDTVIASADGINAVLVQSIAAASGVGAIYAAEIIATPIAPTFTLQLGDRQFTLTLPSTGLLTFSCDMLLNPNDIRSITSIFPGNWFLELMGEADVRNRT